MTAAEPRSERSQQEGEQWPELGPKRADARAFIGQVMTETRGSVRAVEALSGKAKDAMADVEKLSGEERVDGLVSVAELRRAEARVADGLEDDAGAARALAQWYKTSKEAAGTTTDPRVTV